MNPSTETPDLWPDRPDVGGLREAVVALPFVSGKPYAVYRNQVLAVIDAALAAADKPTPEPARESTPLSRVAVQLREAAEAIEEQDAGSVAARASLAYAEALVRDEIDRKPR